MAETVESYLLGYHARFPGITSRTFARGRIDDSRSSYDALCDVACAALSAEPPTPKPLLLDLGCGDGYLLERLVQRGLDPAQLVGIDMSPDELTLARARPALAGATLRCERAQTMSLASTSVTCVVSHLAFIHMIDPEEVVAEIARVLCPGGVFSTLLMGKPRSLAPNAFALFLDHFTRIEDSVACEIPTLVDHRLRSSGGLAAFFHQRTGFDELAIDNLEVSLDGSPEEIWHSLSGIYEGRYGRRTRWPPCLCASSPVSSRCARPMAPCRVLWPSSSSPAGACISRREQDPQIATGRRTANASPSRVRCGAARSGVASPELFNLPNLPNPVHTEPVRNNPAGPSLLEERRYRPLGDNASETGPSPAGALFWAPVSMLRI